MSYYRSLTPISRDVSPISRIVVIDADIPSRCLLFNLLTRVTRGENGPCDFAAHRQKIIRELGVGEGDHLSCKDIAHAMAHSRIKLPYQSEILLSNVIMHPHDRPIDIINIRKQ